MNTFSAAKASVWATFLVVLATGMLSTSLSLNAVAQTSPPAPEPASETPAVNTPAVSAPTAPSPPAATGTAATGTDSAPKPAAPAPAPAPAVVAAPPNPVQIRQELRREQRARVRALLKQGAAGLAAQLVEGRQGEPTDLADWLRWERLRLEAYARLGRHADIVTRVTQVPSSVPFAAARDFQAFAAAARIELKEASAARDMLRALLWSGPAAAEKRAHWRRLVIRSYAIEGRYDDARSAMLRYQVEYRPKDDQWMALQARVLVLAEDYDTALLQLDTPTNDDARAMKILAQLRGAILTPNQAIDALDKLRKEMPTTSPTQPLVWTIRAEAAKRAGNAPMRVAALEQLALVAGDTQDLLINFDDNALWKAWLELGIAQGNIANLLQGDDASWIKTARELSPKSAIGARALYAWVIRNGTNLEAIRMAQSGLAELLVGDSGALTPVAIRVFGEDGEFNDPAVLAPTTRLTLSDSGLKLGDMSFAAMMLRDLAKPPGEMTEGEWALRRARIHILAGEFEDGAGLLQNWLDTTAVLNADEVDRVLQPVFDLQSVDEHELALPLFERLMTLAGEVRHQREISYWTAESASGAGRDAEAAELYLRSADLAGPEGILWARSARYQAAEAMASAGLVRDARVLFEGLLELETEESRRVRIERRMQQLHLIEAQQRREKG